MLLRSNRDKQNSRDKASEQKHESDASQNNIS